MKKILESTPETREYLKSLPIAGKCTTDGIPFVWMYDDYNGTCDCYFLRKWMDLCLDDK